MKALGLSSRRERLLHRALRARRNRSQLSHLGCQTREELREAEDNLAHRWRSAQRLRSIRQHVANGEAGRPFRLRALSSAASRSDVTEKRREGACALPKLRETEKVLSCISHEVL